MRRTPFLALVFLTLVVPVFAFAEDAPHPVTVASFFKVLPGKGEAVMEMFKKVDKPVLDKLMADGTIVGWGMGMPWVHTGGAWNLVFWISTADMAAREKVEKAFEAAEKTRPAEENRKLQEAFYAAVAMDAHRDGVYRQVLRRTGKAPANPEGKGYLWLGHYTAKPGKDLEATSFFGESVTPVMDTLVADGVVGGYGVLVPTVHVAGASTHTIWYWVDTLGGVDKVQAVLRAAREKRSKEQNAALDARSEAIFQPATHSDDLVQVTMSGGR
jgi:hypothetical protein